MLSSQPSAHLTGHLTSATSKPPSQRGWLARLLVVCAIGCSLFCAGCGSPPALVHDEAVLTEVEALWTAVLSRKPDLVTEVEARLKPLHEEGKLSKAGWTTLNGIIEQTRAEQWDAARDQLRWIIRNQPRN
jgi:hypothetical protein